METWTRARHPKSLLLDAFVPAIVRRRLARCPSPPIQPADERFDAALLLTDLSGFTSLAERFASRGPRGAEDLSDVLNFFCGHLVDLTEAHGGEVVRFSGDAALAMWPVGERNGVEAAQAAAQCGAAAQRTFEELEAPDGVRLSLRAGIGFGKVWAATVGGVGGRWELLVSGEPFAEAVQAMSLAAPGDVAVGASAWARLASHAQGSNIGLSCMRLDGLTDRVPTSSPAPVDACPSSWLRPYVPRSVQARLDAGQSDWLAEFRPVTTLFIKLDTLEPGAQVTLERLQRAIVTVQTAVYRYGGSLNQLVVDDKGTVFVCGWGLALHAHGDDQARAVRAACDAREGLQGTAVNASFGVATGTVFAGLLGNYRRCRYALIGDIVNVAARLMQTAGAGEILCDLASFEAASSRVAFETLPAITVKGRQRPVEVFRALEVSAGGSAEIVGRVVERQVLRKQLDALAANTGGVVILEGDSGIGKSRLVADLIQRAVAKGIRTMVASADAIERSAPYHVWCGLFDNLLGLDAVAGRSGAERRIIELLETKPRLVVFAPLLNPLLNLNFRQTDESERIPPRGRALVTRELLIHLFRCTVGRRPTLLVLEDAHWLDSSSWTLAEAIAREVPEVLLLVAIRPLGPKDQPRELQRLSERQGTLRIHLDALSPQEAQALVCHRLRARALSEPVAHLIRDKAEGHPFFTEELAYALRDRGLIEVDQGICRLTAAAAATASVQLPNSVQVMVSSRIDQLNVEQQLTLKVASVFGRTFELAAVRSVYPIDIAERDLESHVDALIERHLLQQARGESGAAYAFKHVITREAAYNLLPYALRRQLHAAAAGWYERQHPGDVSPFYPLLAYHWSRAEAGERATFYLEHAGDQALQRHANEEALRFFNEALEIDEKLAPARASNASTVVGGRRTVSPRDARRIRWERCLGEAATNLGRWDDGRRHFTKLLRLMGHSLPTSDREFGVGIGKQIAVQCLHRLMPRVFNRSSGQARELLPEAVCAYERIGALSYQDGRMIAVIYSLVAALNVAERVGPTLDLGLVYGDVANVLSLVPLPRLARVYHGMVTRTAAQLPDSIFAARVRARAALSRLAVGDWSACADLETAMALSKQIGDSYHWEENAAVRARGALVQGDFDTAARLGTEVRTRAVATGSVPHEVWGLTIEVWVSRNRGDDERALELAKTGLRLVSVSRPDLLAEFDFHGVTALAHLDRFRPDAAHEAARRIVDILASVKRLVFFSELGISAAAEVCLAIWETRAGAGASIQVRGEVLELCRRLEQFPRVNPPVRARAALWRGCAEWLDGQPERARGTWRTCLDHADRFGLPYEGARAHYEIGRRLERNDPERLVHLAKAEAEFRRLSIEPDVRRVKAALRAE
jgi:class 3 adenylate cyclase/tetratricopeptide (TPR) repeat protein